MSAPSEQVPSSPPESSPEHSRWLIVAAAGACLGFAIWVIAKWGGFDLTTTITINGTTTTVPNTFAAVDHPFHAARGDSFLKAIQNGHLLRWVGSHQGGYPAEFYPLGIAAFDTFLWAMTFGAFPVAAIHKLAILIIFVLPVAGFWLLARGDKLSPFVPLLALTIHVAYPGIWTSGGLVELVEWGLVANVGGATLAFVGVAALARYVAEGERLHGVIAVLCIAGAMYANSRSGIPIAVTAIGIGIASALGHAPWLTDDRIDLKWVLSRIVRVALLSGMLAAPLLLAMARYRDLYFFVNYKEYDDVRMYYQESLDALSGQVVLLAVIGGMIAFVASRLLAARAVAVTAILYCLLTAVLSGNALNEGLIQQLESPRLMPFQRLLFAYLAAALVGWVAARLVRFVPAWREWAVAVVLIAGSWIALSQFPGVYGEMPADEVMHEEQTTGVGEMVMFSSAVKRANDLVGPGQAIYVIGDQKSWWHEQLWGPVYAGAPMFYDDWMWYWHQEPVGPCNPKGEHTNMDPGSTLNEEWLASRGIGVVVVTNRGDLCSTQGKPRDPRHVAENNPALTYDSTYEYWDVYRVSGPSAIVTNGTALPVESSVSNGSIDATFENASGVVTIRQNWFPRWEATVDGESVPVRESADGFMEIEVPPGSHKVQLRYTVTGLDWFGRGAALLGGLGVVGLGFGIPVRFRFRWLAGDPAVP